jgi:DNA helicase MCM8
VALVHARFLCISPLNSFASIDSEAVNTLVSIRGNVLHVSPVRPLLVLATFACTLCGDTQALALTQGKFDQPQKCTGKGCRGNKFTVVHDQCTTEDWQQVELQELDQDAAAARGGGGGGGAAHAERSALRTLKVELSGDIVDKCRVGDLVQAVGVLQAIELDIAQGKGIGRNKLIFSSFVDANSIVATRPDEKEPCALRAAAAALMGPPTASLSLGGSAAAASVTRFFSPKELEGFSRIRSSPNPAALLIASAVPSIFGLHAVKLGLLLCLMGGTAEEDGAAAEGHPTAAQAAAGGSENCSPPPGKKPRGGAAAAAASPPATAPAPAPAHTAVPIRSSIHVLIVGDPGLGKSQLLRAVSSLAPRSAFVTGGFESSSVGLTASLSNEAKNGGSVLNAGALVLADRGVCAIDELDKMPGEHTSLLEAMEQQRVTVAKAGTVSWLPARTSVMAAANPCSGRFDRGRTVSENLKMPAALLSRFDLIFIVMDKQDRRRDESLGEHVMRAVVEAGSGGGARQEEEGGGGGGGPHEGAAGGQLRWWGGKQQRQQQQQQQQQ